MTSSKNKPVAYQLFQRSVCVILFLTCAAKVISAFGSAEILYHEDVVFRLSYRWVMLLAAGYESVAITAILLSRGLLKAIVIQWTALSFMVYRALVWALGAPAPCPCLGSITGALGISQHAANLGLQAVIAYMFLGSAYFLVSPLFGVKATEPIFRNSGRDRRQDRDV